MTVGELVQEIEDAGYRLNFAMPPDFLPQEVIVAPLVLVVREPPVKDECVFVDDYLKVRQHQGFLHGYVRIEGAVSTTSAMLVKLQFVKEQR